jgi:hemoglobin
VRDSLPITVAISAGGPAVSRHARAAAAANAKPRPDVDDGALVPLLTAFYAAVGRDPQLGPYFAGLDMTAHIPRIADFWSTLLFHSGRYTGNAFRPHAVMRGLQTTHFDRWLAALEAVVDARHTGPVAERMKALGHRVAYSMQLRLGLAPITGAPAVPRRAAERAGPGLFM